MNKYQIGQEIFYIKYIENHPTLVSFEIEVAKLTKAGYKYATISPGALYIPEDRCFPTAAQAVQGGIEELSKLIKEGVKTA